jgi:hypothetical protein
MRFLHRWLHGCAQKARRGILASIADILIYSIATLNCMCLLHDKPGRKVRFEGLRKVRELGWVSRDYITVLRIAARDQPYTVCQIQSF